MGLFEKKVTPDVESLMSIIRRTAAPKRVHNIELFLDEEIKEQVCERFDLNAGCSGEYAYLQREIKLHRFLGYDVFCVKLAWDAFKITMLVAEDTTSIEGQKRGDREWIDEHVGPIQSFNDFENYPWPKVGDIDFGPLQWLDKNLPENMGCYCLTAHILEMTTWLLGYETLCFKLYDDRELVDAIFQKIGEFYVDFTHALCDFSCVKIVWGSDDMGFRTSTLLAPEILRQKALPWHKRCAEIAHDNDRPYPLHSCGKLDEIMDDLIDDVLIDARHSYEDVIMPVTEAKKVYGSRIAILGGIDMDFLCCADERAIRKRVRDTLDICTVGGGYCLGTGNTVANYIPLDNYLVMLDEGRNFAL